MPEAHTHTHILMASKCKYKHGQLAKDLCREMEILDGFRRWRWKVGRNVVVQHNDDQVSHGKQSNHAGVLERIQLSKIAEWPDGCNDR